MPKPRKKPKTRATKSKKKKKSEKPVAKQRKPRALQHTLKPASNGSKAAIVAELLGRTSGVSLEELIAKTGWQPHTCRAKISVLRKAGHKVEKSRNADGILFYRMIGGSTEQVAAASKR